MTIEKPIALARPKPSEWELIFRTFSDDPVATEIFQLIRQFRRVKMVIYRKLFTSGRVRDINNVLRGTPLKFRLVVDPPGELDPDREVGLFLVEEIENRRKEVSIEAPPPPP